MSSRHRSSRARTPLRLDTAAIIVPAVESSAGLRAVRDHGSPREADPQWTRVSGSLSPDLSPEMTAGSATPLFPAVPPVRCGWDSTGERRRARR